MKTEELRSKGTGAQHDATLVLAASTRSKRDARIERKSPCWWRSQLRNRLLGPRRSTLVHESGTIHSGRSRTEWESRDLPITSSFARRHGPRSILEPNSPILIFGSKCKLTGRRGWSNSDPKMDSIEQSQVRCPGQGSGGLEYRSWLVFSSFRPLLPTTRIQGEASLSLDPRRPISAASPRSVMCATSGQKFGSPPTASLLPLWYYFFPP